MRNALFDANILRSVKLPGFTISIGNITAGGTGKSPFTVLVALELLGMGRNPAILTRGYGSKLGRTGRCVLLDGTIVARSKMPRHARIPDEAMMQSKRLPTVPVVIGAQRAAAAAWYLKLAGDQAPTHWILDDGFQHRYVRRDLDIVLLDAQEPFGNGKLLPLGTLREDVTGLERADLLVFTRVLDDDRMLPALAKPSISVRFATLWPVLEGKTGGEKLLATDRALLLSGIAHPGTFASALRVIGVPIGKTYFVSDHGTFSAEQILQKLGDCNAIVTTAKDYWRQPDLWPTLALPVYVADLELHLSPDDRGVLLSKLR